MDSPLLPNHPRGLSLKVLALVVAALVVMTGMLVCLYLDAALPGTLLPHSELQAAPNAWTGEAWMEATSQVELESDELRG